VAATNPALLANLSDNETAGQAKDELFNLRAVLDGRLLSLPGGDLRVALGYEYMHDGYKQRYLSDIRIGTLANNPFLNYGRHIHSFFGELNIPVFGSDNATVGIQSLVLSASGRYDSYSDFGHTFNPKLGATYKPVSWLSVRGNWGTSFTAPTPLDQLGVQRTTLLPFGFAAFVNPRDNPLPGGITAYQTLSYQGALANLKPQTADTWSIGFDAVPPFVPGLHASLSYYKVKFKNILATPSSNVGIFTNFPNNIISNPNGVPLAQILALRNTVPTANASIAQALADGRPIYEIVDFRTGNYGTLWVSGLDFDVRYRREVGFGSVDLGVNGNLQLERKSQTSSLAPVVDVLHGDDALSNDGASALAMQTTLGTNIGGLRAQVSWNYTGGYNIVPTVSVPVQDKVASYSTINLYFKYDVPGDSALLKGLSFTLNVNNLFDQDPPILRRNLQNEFGFPSTFLNVGRLVIFGVSKQF
jgi:iron complex outermembrane receptor protein